MNKKSSILILATSAMLMAGCESKTGTGVLLGGATGAAIGGIASGSGTGALIGGAAGVIAGGLIGAYLDNEDQKNLHRQSPQTYKRVENSERLSVNDIINLSKANVDDDKIITLIEKTNSHYTLNNYQIEKLEKNDVSKRGINYMMYST